MKQKILIILDHDYKTKKKYDMLREQINLCYGDNYDIVFKLFDNIQKQYNYVPDNIQMEIDSETIYAYIDNYACVITDGPSAYFWLQSFYDGNLIAINPTIDIYKEYPYDLEYNDKDLKMSREFQTNNTVCILSNEMKDYIEEYDNQFYDTTVILANENLNDIKSFWNIDSTFDQVFNYMVNNYED